MTSDFSIPNDGQIIVHSQPLEYLISPYDLIATLEKRIENLELRIMSLEDRTRDADSEYYEL